MNSLAYREIVVGLRAAGLPRLSSREVHTFGKLKESQNTYLNKEIEELAKKVSQRYQIANVPDSKTTKKFNSDAVYNVTSEYTDTRITNCYFLLLSLISSKVSVVIIFLLCIVCCRTPGYNGLAEFCLGSC